MFYSCKDWRNVNHVKSKCEKHLLFLFIITRKDILNNEK